MTSVRAVQCASCGGSVANPAGEAGPRCVFCGRADLRPLDVPAGVEPPEAFLPFALDDAAAHAAFRAFTRRRIWAPASIDRAEADLRRVFVPAWVWSGEVETHWAALVPAPTRSGKRPATGQERGREEGVLVPSSPALTGRELNALGPFDGADLRVLRDEPPPEPYELGVLTRAVARQRGVDRMAELHGARIGARLGASRMRAASVAIAVVGRPLLLPVVIGAYLVDGRSYRVVLHGRSGQATGTAPVSWWKVLVAVAAAVVAAAVVVAAASGS